MQEIDRDTKIKEKAARVPAQFRTQYLRAAYKKAPPSMAIKAFCRECVGYSDIKNMVGNCTALACPLWMYRPYQKKENVK
jgi:hypothetical protein